MWKRLIITVLLQINGTNALAACENFLTGFTVDSYYYGNNPNEVTYYNISSVDRGLKATISAYSNLCTGPDCKNSMDFLRDAAATRQLVKFGVTGEICSNLDQYTIMINGGGSCSLIPIQKITSLGYDPNYPF